MTSRQCRFCAAELVSTFADLGMSPASNSFIPAAGASAAEPFYPLHAFVCDSCRLVQLEEFETPQEIFSDYLYFSSFSESWLAHCRAHADAMTDRFGLGARSKVVELASNDGYLLQFFKNRNVPVLGIDPAANVAAEAIAKGIDTEVAFFGVETATRLRATGVAPDLMLANNVLAHVPDINDFVAGIAILLKNDGLITVEFPHLLNLIQFNQFDTIYHEHFSYLSLHVVQRVFARHGLRVFEVEQLATHGGSLRVYACHKDGPHDEHPSVGATLQREQESGLEDPEVYRKFAQRVIDTKFALLQFLLNAKREGKKVVGYGAPAKGNTLLNYCGIRTDFLDFTVDRSPHKQGMLLPGVRIPIRAPEAIFQEKPDYVLILPWNLKDEIMTQMTRVREWGGRFVVPIPAVTVL